HSRVRRKRMGHIELAAPVVHPWFLTAPHGLADLFEMQQEDLEKFVYYDKFVVTHPGQTGFTSAQLLTQNEYKDARNQFGPEGFQTAIGADAVRHLLRVRNPASIKLDWIVLECVPVLPPDLRPLVLLASGDFSTSDLNDLYCRIINCNNHL